MTLIRGGSLVAVVALVVAASALPAPTVHRVRNGLIVFSSYRAYDGLGASIYTITPAGKRAQRLTRTAAEDTMPQWSPDGRSIAFTRAPDITAPSSIYVMSAARGNPKQVTPTGMDAFGPSWSPDGKRLAFAYDGGIGILDLPTGKVTNLTSGGGGPAWSPDGGRIAFVGGDNRIYTIHPNRSGLKRITRGAANYGSLSWAPDSARLVTDIPSTTKIGLHVADLLVVTLSGARRLLRAPANALNPAWSPDGKRIAFSADPAPRESDYDIYVMNARGGGVRAVTTDGLGSDWPDWQPLR